MLRSTDGTLAQRLRVFRTQSGFSYVEVLVATALLAGALVPALDALRDSIAGGAVQQQIITEHHHLAGKMEELLSLPFDELDAEAQAVGDPNAATSYSDAVSTPDRRRNRKRKPASLPARIRGAISALPQHTPRGAGRLRRRLEFGGFLSMVAR